MVDRYYESGYAVPVPGGSERGYVREKEEKCCELNNKKEMDCRADVSCHPAVLYVKITAFITSWQLLGIRDSVFFPQNFPLNIGKKSERKFLA